MAAPEFASCWLKISRAEEHFVAIKDILSAWRDSNPYAVVKKYDPKTGRHSLAVNIRGAVPFDRLSLIAGDAAHNLRCALDHLAYALAVVNSGQNPPPNADRIQFPIVDSPDAFAGQAYRIQSLSRKAQDFIESAQPYHGKHPFLPPILGVLNVFENLDKHRLIHLTYDGNFGGSIGLIMNNLRAAPTITWFHKPLQSGDEFVYFTTEPAQPDLEYQFEVSFSIGVSHIPGPMGRTTSPLESVIGGMLDEVKRIVIGAT